MVWEWIDTVKKTFRPYHQGQLLLLPPSIEEWVPENHLARFVNDTVEQMDLSAILRVYERESRGYPPYHPAMLLKVLVYGYATGVYCFCPGIIRWGMLSRHVFRKNKVCLVPCKKDPYFP